MRARRVACALREPFVVARLLPLLGLATAFVLAAPAAGDVYSKKQAVDSQIAALHAQMAAAEAREDALSAQVASVSDSIRALERQVGDVSARLAALERDLALHRRRLARLTALLELQTRRLEFLRREYQVAVRHLARRLVALYQQDAPTTLDVIVSATSFTDALDQLDYAADVARQDAHISAQVKVARDEMRIVRARTKRTRASVAAATRVIAIRTAQVQALRARLVARKSGLEAAHRAELSALSSVRHAHSAYAERLDDLRSESAQLSAQIQAAQAAAAATQSYSPTAAVTSHAASSSGFIWPVNGPVVSGFGMRWGRMHEGIDIAAGYGTAIRAAASGTVISAGWMGGYGNLIVIDHGGGLATAYAHQSGFAVGYGQHVSQGQTIGYVGCTGHCFGPHLHFEVRVNGAAVDPLGYL